jgi:hypothetical protein
MLIETFSEKVRLGVGEPLGGSDPSRFSCGERDPLEVNGISFKVDGGRDYRLCSLDALYAGALVRRFESDPVSHVFAASHTHYAPMLDENKPHIGGFSNSACQAFADALIHSRSNSIRPTHYRLYRSEVDVPVYRRFDYPDNFINRLLSKNFGFFPNESLEIDRSIYIFVFFDDHRALFSVVYHACHPVTLGVSCELSADYVAVIRRAVRERFSLSPVLFFQGCAGDVRPNVAKKRIKSLPKFRLNWRFNWQPSSQVLAEVEKDYSSAVLSAVPGQIIPISGSFSLSSRKIALHGMDDVEVFHWVIPGGVEFIFCPFEISHLYHLDAMKSGSSRFIVSCSNNTLGYLSHPTQHKAGGYEVNQSLSYMGLSQRIEIKEPL